MATAALVRDVFGSDSDTDDARDAREPSTEAPDAIESGPARAPFKSSLELDDDADDADDDAKDTRQVESTPLHIELASDARVDARETEETAQIAKYPTFSSRRRALTRRRTRRIDHHRRCGRCRARAREG